MAAIRRYSLTDRLTTVVTAGASAIPVFVLGFLLQYGFAVAPEPARLAGVGPAADVAARPGHVDVLLHPDRRAVALPVLPAVTLASVSTALAARMTRGSMLEVLRADYMRTARAKGLRERDVVARHGLRNAMLPVVTLIGIDFGTVIGAAILTENTVLLAGARVGDRRTPSSTATCP